MLQRRPHRRLPSAEIVVKQEKIFYCIHVIFGGCDQSIIHVYKLPIIDCIVLGLYWELWFHANRMNPKLELILN